MRLGEDEDAVAVDLHEAAQHWRARARRAFDAGRPRRLALVWPTPGAFNDKSREKKKYFNQQGGQFVALFRADLAAC